MSVADSVDRIDLSEICERMARTPREPWVARRYVLERIPDSDPGRRTKGYYMDVYNWKVQTEDQEGCADGIACTDFRLGPRQMKAMAEFIAHSRQDTESLLDWIACAVEKLQFVRAFLRDGDIQEINELLYRLILG